MKQVFMLMGLFCTIAHGWAATQTWDGGGANGFWNTAKNWGSNIVPVSTDDVIFGSGFSSSLSVNLNGDRTVNSLTINTVTGFSLTNSTLTLTSGNLTRNDLAATEASQTISSAVVLGADGTFVVNGSGTLLMAGNISRTTHSLSFDGAGALTISGIISGGYSTTTKNGTGTVTLSGANTFDGPIIINSGVVNLQNSSALGASTYGNTVASGAALELQGGITVGEDQVGISGTGVSGAGALRSRSGNNSFSGQISFMAASAVVADSGTLTLSGSQGLDYNGTYGGSGNIIISGPTYGTGSLTKSGSGTLTFTGNDSISHGGGTVVSQGTMVLNKGINNTFTSDFTVGTGNGAATLRLGSDNQIADHLQVTVNNQGTFDLNGKSETIGSVVLGGSGQITTGSGTLTLGGAAAVTTTASSSAAIISGKLNVTAFQPVFEVAQGGAATDLNIAADLTATSGFVKSGAGTMKLTGTVTSTSLSEAITINAGTLLLGAANRISDNSPIRLAGGTLATGGFSETVGALTLTSNSQIDLGSGSSSLVFAASTGSGWTAGKTLTIQNWSGSYTGAGTDRVYVGSSGSGLTTSQLSQIRFENPVGAVQGYYTAQMLGTGEIVPSVPVPVPEPATIFSCAILGIVIVFKERKRLRTIFTCA